VSFFWPYTGLTALQARQTDAEKEKVSRGYKFNINGYSDFHIINTH
jgi:hypothetical protein